MKIGIIGAGNVGQALARASVRAGHEVHVSDNDQQEAEKLANDVGGVAGHNNDVIAAAQLVILAVPFDAVEHIVAQAGSALDGKLLVDVTNRFAAEDLGSPSNAEHIQSQARGAKVLKAFNTVFAGNQDTAEVDGVQLDGFVAGDDAQAKKQVLEFVESLGFRPVDTGPLATARALEGMGTLNIALNMNNGWSWKTAWKLVGPLG